MINRVWYGTSPVKWLLLPLTGLYSVAIKIRRLCYRRGLLKTTRLAVPVVVVGNISVGGTGKTPFIIWLAGELQRHGHKVGIVSRGYRGNAQSWPQKVTSDSDPMMVGDEPVMLARATGCPVMVGPGRVATAQSLIAGEHVDVILSDDGMQHYALGRSMEIAVVDGERGLGNGFLLPAGPLREPSNRLAEVDAVVVNGGSWGDQTVIRTQAVAKQLFQVAGSGTKSLHELRNTKVHAVAAIGNPTRFFGLLQLADIEVIPHPLPDHAVLKAADLDFADSLPVLITEKDAVKCASFASQNVWCVPIKLEFHPDDAQRLIAAVLEKTSLPVKAAGQGLT